MNFRHASVGTSSLNTIHSASRLLLPVLNGEEAGVLSVTVDESKLTEK